MIAPAYLLHFYYGLRNSAKRDAAASQDPHGHTIPAAANFYIAVVIAAGIWLISSAIQGWHSPDLARLTAYLIAGVLASACKIPLPGIGGTVSLGFVPVLFNLAELELCEATARSRWH